MLKNTWIKFFFTFLFLFLLFNPLYAITGDLDGDGDVDRNDLNILLLDRNKPVSQSFCGTPCDLDGDGIITGLDARRLVLLCTLPRCAIVSHENQPPIANAGDDIIIAIPEGQTTVNITLDGSASYDPDGNITQYIWTGDIDPDDVVNPVVSLKQGIYTFNLVVKDDRGNESSADQIKVTILGPPLIMPFPEVTDQSILTLKGISVPGSTVIIKINSTHTQEIFNETGYFETSINLIPGLNEIKAIAKIDNIQSYPVVTKTTYTLENNLILDSINPSQGQAGSILTLTGSGFTPDTEIMGVYFKGSKYESKGGVIEATETALKVFVPFIFLNTDEELEVYVYDGKNMSNRLSFHVLPALDPTPDVQGNEVDYQLDLIISQLSLIFSKMEEWTKPNLPQEQWYLLEENIRKIQNFVEILKDRVDSIPKEEIKANLDAVFGSEVFSLVNQKLELINDILSHTSPCDINEVIEILEDVLEPIEVINDILDHTLTILWAGLVGDSIACFFGCAPCCAAIPFIWEAIETISAIDGIVDAILSVVDTVIDTIRTAIPTIPTEWKVSIDGPFPGISNHILYTYTTNTLSVYANFTNAGFEDLLRENVDLRIDIPDPFGLFAIVRMVTNVDIESLFEEALGSLLVQLTIDLLDIDEIHITVTDISVSSTVEHTNPQSPLIIENEGSERDFHTIITGSAMGVDDLDIQAACGNYQYPIRTKCELLVGDICIKWGTDYPRYFPVEVIDVPIIEDWRWELKTYWDDHCKYIVEDDRWEGCWKERYDLVVSGKGFSASGNTYGRWEQDLYLPYDFRYDSLTFPGIEWGHKPGRFYIYTWREDEATGEIYIRKSAQLFITASPDLEAGMYFNNPSLYPGDTLYVFGNYFAQNDTTLTLSYGSDKFGPVLPNDLWYGYYTMLDSLGFHIPEFHTAGYDYSGVTLRATIKVRDGRGCEPNNCDEGEVKILPYESAGETIADDHDLWIFGPQPGARLRTVAIGDLNGDGINDLIVGVPGYSDDLGYDIGAVYIVFGPVEGDPGSYGNRTVGTIDLRADFMNWDVAIIGDTNDITDDGSTRHIGNSLAVGDINGDGIDDLLIGTGDKGQTHIPGKAYLFFGRRNWESFYFISAGYNVMFHGDDKRELGYRVGIGRIYGEDPYYGAKDIVITAPSESDQMVDRTYVIRGWRTGPDPEDWRTEIRLPDDLIANPYFTLIEGKHYYQEDIVDFRTGEYIQYLGDGMGKAIALGDVNGDGLDDIILGAPDYGHVLPGSPFRLLQGAVYIFYGGSDLHGTLYADAMTTSDVDFSIWGPVITGNDERTGFASSVHVVDLDGDGRGEIIIGAPKTKLKLDLYPSMLLSPSFQSIANIEKTLIGRIYIIDGTNPKLYDEYDKNISDIDDEADVIINGSGSIAAFGYSLSSGDLNNDGLKDLLVGAPGNLSNDRGHVWVLYGSASPGWRDTPERDLIHLENRRWYTNVKDFENYATDAGRRLEEGFDYLFVGPFEHHDYELIPERFGSFIIAGDLNPYIGDDILITSPIGSAPVPYGSYDYRNHSGVLYIFYEGTNEYWPLGISPETSNMNFCNSEQTLTVKGGLKPYQFELSSCYVIIKSVPPYENVIECGYPLPDNFYVNEDSNSIQIRVTGCIPGDLDRIILTVTDARSESITRDIEFLKPDISVSSTSVDFRNIMIGLVVSHSITVSNNGNYDLEISDIQITGSPDISQSNNCPAILSPGSNCEIWIVFTPSAIGEATSLLTISSNDPDEQTVNINVIGNGVTEPDIRIIGGSLVFRDVVIGSSQSLDILIWNGGLTDLYINNISISGAPQFAITKDDCTGSPLPPHDGSYNTMCTITITFTPTGIDPVYGTISIESNDPDTPVFTGNLSGAGITPYISVAPSSIDFGETSTEAFLTIQNTSSTRSLTWNIIPDLPSWLSVSPMSGETGAGLTEGLTVNVDRTGLDAGVYQHTLSITSDGGVGSVMVSMEVSPYISISPVSIDFKEARKRKVLTIQNISPSTLLYWSIADNLPEWLTASQMSGSIAPGESVNIYLYADRSGLVPDKTYTHPLTITSNGGDEAVLVSIIVPVPLTTFAKYYGDSDTGGGEYLSVIHQTSDGGFITAGLTSSFNPAGYVDEAWIVKLDSSGYVQWEKRIPGAQRAYDVKETLDGGYIVVAYSQWVDNSGGIHRNMWLLKLNSFGDIEWDRSYSGDIDHNIFGDWGENFSVNRTPDGGYIIAGNTTVSDPQGRMDIWILKVDSMGNVQWQKSLGTPWTGTYTVKEYANSIQPTLDGGFVVSGVISSLDTKETDIFVLKINSSGNIEWQKKYGDGSVEAYEIQQTTDGGYVVAGTTFSFGGAWVIKLDSLGNIEWQKTYGGWGGYGHSIKQTADGGYIVAGTFYRSGRGDDIWLLKLDALGNIEWQKAYGGDNTDVAYFVEQTAEGNYVVAGYTRSFRTKPPYNTPNYDAIVLKVDQNGNIGTSCGLVDITDVVPSDISITGIDAGLESQDTNSIPDDTRSTVIDTSATSNAICFEIPDTDGDGITDPEEYVIGTDPTNPDTDGDGLLDGFENRYGLDPLTPETNNDPDGDGLNNITEQDMGTSPVNSDTDGDGLSDGQEVNTYGSDPLNTDTDDDGLSDYDEVVNYGTSPVLIDTDSGGRTDYQEVVLDGTDPLVGTDDEVAIVVSDGITPSGQPDVAMDYNGNLHVVWVAWDPYTGGEWGSNQVFYTMLAPDGSTLIDDTVISNFASNVKWPSLTVDSQGKVHIVWVDRISLPFFTSSGTIWHTLIDPYLDDQDGTPANEALITLIDDQAVSITDVEKTRPDIAADSTGRVHVVWAEWPILAGPYGDPVKTLELHHSIIASNGQIEIADHVIFTGTDSQWDPAYPQIAVDNQDNAHIVWLTYDSNYEMRVHYKMLNSSGQTLIDSTPLSPSGLASVNRPSVMARVNAQGDPEVIVAYAVPSGWEAVEEEFFILRINPYAALLDGSPVDPATIITEGQTSLVSKVYAPSIFLDTTGNSLIAWYSGDVQWTPRHVYLRSIAPDGSITVSQRQLTDDPTATVYGELTRPVILRGSNFTYIFWSDSHTGTPSILLRRIR